MLKKPLIIFLILLIIILAIFTIVYFIQKPKTPKDQAAQPTTELTREAEELGQIIPLKEVILSTDKAIYGPNEEIKVTGIIRNPFPQTKTWTAVYYFMSEDEISFSALGQTEKLELKPGQTEKLEFISLVNENLPPGDYKTKLEILEQEQVISSKTKIIVVEGTKKILTAELKTCSDIGCDNEKAVFTQSESIYIQVSCDISNINIEGKIKYPGAEEQQDLDFNQNLAAISADQLGSYEIIVNITKDGYQSISIKKDFAVIKSSPQIESASKCDANGKCEGEENVQNCPQDCQ